MFGLGEGRYRWFKVEIKYKLPCSDVIFTKRRLIEHPERPKDGFKSPEERLIKEIRLRTKDIQPLTMSAEVACASGDSDCLARLNGYEVDLLEYHITFFKLDEMVRTNYEQGLITQIMIETHGIYYKFKAEGKADQWVIQDKIHQDAIKENIKLCFYIGEDVIYRGKQCKIGGMIIKKDKSVYYHIANQQNETDDVTGHNLSRMWL